jgi:4-hydroxyphenylpyruvate dioxygenase
MIIVVSSAIEHQNSQFNQFIGHHGDSVVDIAFKVSSCEAVYRRAIAAGAISVQQPTKTVCDGCTTIIAAIKTVADTIHTLVERHGQQADSGQQWLPGFIAVDKIDPVAESLAAVGAEELDHIGINIPEGDLESLVQWYEKVFGFKRFFSIDDSIVHSQYSGLRSIVMSDPHENVKLPLIEPVAGARKGQIEEFLEFHGGAGAQHFAVLTDDILATAKALRERGVDRLELPKDYFPLLQERIKGTGLSIEEDFNALAEFDIMLDLDDDGYLLQLFTKPMADRPTVFFEFIQRRSFDGFGANNFKSIFEAIEKAQKERGNLL